VDHPDIIDFIACKEGEGVFNNFNISIAVTERFMQALEEDAEYELINPRTGKAIRKPTAREVFDKIVEGAWRNGEPGIIFLDRMNDFNPTPALGQYESTNPCGEQILLSHESCNLGSINLSRMLTTQSRIDWEKLARTVKMAVHFLDNVIATNRFPLPEIEGTTLRTRKIGLGVMGFADMLIQLGIPYDSEEAEAVAEKVMEAISFWSKEASCELAAIRGSFPAFDESIYARGGLPLSEPLDVESHNQPQCLADAPALDWEELKERIKEQGVRNATTTTIAPTGSISMIAGVSSGIEPLFALAYTRRHILDEDELSQVNPLLEISARERGFYSAELMREVAERGSIQGLKEIPADVHRLFVTAHDIAPEWHIRMQATYQRYVDNAVSKTINFPHHATVEDVRKAYLLAYELGCKGITVYRDGSREEQVLNKGITKPKPGKGLLAPRPRPIVTRGATEKIVLGCNRTLYVTINEDDEGLCEVFLRMGKSGGCTASQSEAIGRLVSLALRSGIETEAIIKQLKGIRCPSPSWHNGGSALSCSDAIAKSIERYIGGNANSPKEKAIVESTPDILPECPECGEILEPSEGCIVCRSCGYSECL
jgi:ribonucleoside-diphosphate reductase alpha chain